jgi:hypothetical protein
MKIQSFNTTPFIDKFQKSNYDPTRGLLCP